MTYNYSYVVGLWGEKNKQIKKTLQVNKNGTLKNLQVVHRNTEKKKLRYEKQREEIKNKKADLNLNLSTITLSIHGLNTAIKRQRFSEWIKKSRPRGQPGGAAVKFICSTLAARGSSHVLLRPPGVHQFRS